MKIYFSGSIRGGKQDAELYAELIEDLKQYGTVLTEHVGSKITETDLTDKEIHDRDLEWIREADLIVAEVTVPSLGVGYEIGRAIEMNKPIICLYRSIEGKKTSAMIRGCSDLKCFQYSDLDEAKLILKEQIRLIHRNWSDISYLKDGSPIQQKAYACLNKLGILDDLKDYNPILTGTIPIDISTKDSDLDIACKYIDADRFEQVVTSLYSKQSHFIIEQKEKAGYWVVVAKFKFEDFSIEIFGSLYPVAGQNSFRHMLIEDRMLQLLGEGFKKEVLKLKESGIKTEPAFAQLLNLEGDPFVSLLEMEAISDNDILNRWK